MKRKLRVLFVCTGNSCRSPMAEALLRARLPDPWRAMIEVSSAGTAAFDDTKVSSNAVKVLEEIGVDISRHRSRRLAKRMIERSDLIVVMEQKHLEDILALVPSARDKTLAMGSLDPQRQEHDIRDPIGGDEETYRETRKELESLIGFLIKYIESRFGT